MKLFLPAFTILFTLAHMTSATGAPSAARASDAVEQPEYKIYDHAQADHKFRMVIPAGVTVVRGILLVAPCSGGDSRDYHEQVWYRELLHLHNFAFLGAKDYYLHDYKVLQDALRQLAAASKHPELIHAPYAATGFSAGGGAARRLLMAAPDRLIAAAIVGSTLKLNGSPTFASLGTPVCVINGDLEHGSGEAGGMAGALEPVLAEHRPKGALWGWMTVQETGHEMAGQEVLTMPFLDAAVRLRYPVDGDVLRGPLKLKPVEGDSGWIADNTTWKTGLTKVVAAREFKGDVARSSWLLNQDIAFIYRAYSTLDRRLKIVSPGSMDARDEVLHAGAKVVVRLDDTLFANWEKLELYDGGNRLSELAKGPAEFTVKDLNPGYHAFTVLGTDFNGNVHPSNPVLAVVRASSKN